MGSGHMTSQRDDALAEEAAGWIARLTSSDASDQDHNGFQRWYHADPCHAAAYDEMELLWGQMARVPKSVSGRKGVPAKRLAAFCLGGLLVFAAEREGLFLRWQADYLTGVGETRRIALEDGSVVTLNTDSAIDVDLGKAARRITLLRGEAFFDVAADKKRPFTVDANGVEAMALGTHYGVRMDGRTDVMVEAGRVAVSSEGQRRELQGGEAVSVDDTGRLEPFLGDAAAMTSWREGQLVFSGQPLSDVLAEIDRYRAGRIIVIGDAGKIMVSGVFDTHDTDRAIKSLEQSLGLDVIRLSKWLTAIRLPTATK